MSRRQRFLGRLDRGFGQFLLAWEDVCLMAADMRLRVQPAWAVVEAVARFCRRRPLTGGTAVAAVFGLLSFLLFDRPLAWFLKAHMGGDFEGFLKTVTNLGLGGVYLIPSGLLVVVLVLSALSAPSLARRHALFAKAWVPGFVFLSVAVSGLLNNLVKFVLGRYRPRYLFDEGLYGFTYLNHSWAMNSFPSGHSQAAFAAMTALTLVFPRYDIAFYAIAVLVAASRFLTTVHFLSDTIAGAWLGMLVTILIHRALTKRGIDVRGRMERDRRLSE
jgi:membrane-associated phospholipid phosphatase